MLTHFELGYRLTLDVILIFCEDGGYGCRPRFSVASVFGAPRQLDLRLSVLPATLYNFRFARER
jgi:hypothetical protein